MKRMRCFAYILVLLVFSFACNRDNMPQQIRQQINFYIQDKDQKDLLNPNAGKTYFRKVSFLDLNDEKANVQINNITFDKDSNNIYFIKYISGAKRIFLQKNKNNEIYTSDFLIKYNNEQNYKDVDNDTIHVEYSLSPSIFEVQKVYVNNNKVYDINNNTKNTVVIIIKR